MKQLINFYSKIQMDKVGLLAAGMSLGIALAGCTNGVPKVTCKGDGGAECSLKSSDLGVEVKDANPKYGNSSSQFELALTYPVSSELSVNSALISVLASGSVTCTTAGAAATATSGSLTTISFKYSGCAGDGNLSLVIPDGAFKKDGTNV